MLSDETSSLHGEEPFESSYGHGGRLAAEKHAYLHSQHAIRRQCILIFTSSLVIHRLSVKLHLPQCITHVMPGQCVQSGCCLIFPHFCFRSCTRLASQFALHNCKYQCMSRNRTCGHMIATWDGANVQPAPRGGLRATELTSPRPCSNVLQ